MPIERLMQILRRLRPTAAHVLIVERDDGHTFLKSTFNPRGTLQTLHTAGMLTHRWEAIDSAHAEEIALRVSAEFNLYRVDAFGPWFATSYDEMHRVLKDYDAATGARIRDDRFVINQRVQVTGAGRGTVVKVHSKDVVVNLDEPLAGTKQVLAPKALVRPVLRVVTGDAPDGLPLGGAA